MKKTSVKFPRPTSAFSALLKQRVNQYFIDNGLSKTGGKRIGLKASVLFGTLILNYFSLLYFSLPTLVSVALCVVFGVNLALIGFNIMHDAGHGTFSRRPALNSFFGYSLNLLGGNIYFWKLKHNVAHHTYTNVEGEDHDIEVKFMRFHPDQPLKPYHRFQRFYFIFLYSISYLAWIFYQDFEKYFRRRMSKDSKAFALPIREKVIFWGSKALNLILLVVLPVVAVGWINALLGLLIAGMACGICLAIVFQLAHVVTSTSFTSSQETLPSEFMLHQLSTTANFATKSSVLTWLLGGLNFQVEHHLFPKISHIHYPALSKIVKTTCAEFEVAYHEFETFGMALRSHLQCMQAMARA
jgi:linoleoyl-CoA desaturase